MPHIRVENRPRGYRRKIVHYIGRPRLRTGSANPRISRPPKGAAGSDEAILYSDNLLYDPGLELFVGNAVESYERDRWLDFTGSASYILPRFTTATATGQKWVNGDAVDIKDIAQWAQYTEPYEVFPQGGTIRGSSCWLVVRREGSLDYTTDKGPNLGRWMLRWYGWTSSANFALGNGVPGGLLIQGPGLPGGYSARVEPQDLVTWSLYAWVTSTTGTPVMDLCLQFFKQDGTPILSTVSSSNLSTTKTEYQTSSNVPSASYFLRACVTFRGAGSKDTLLQVDTGTLSLR